MTKTFCYILMTCITYTFTTTNTLEKDDTIKKTKKKKNSITSLGSSTPNGAGVRAASCEYKFLLTTCICASFCISSEEKGAN